MRLLEAKLKIRLLMIVNDLTKQIGYGLNYNTKTTIINKSALLEISLLKKTRKMYLISSTEALNRHSLIYILALICGEFRQCKHSFSQLSKYSNNNIRHKRLTNNPKQLKF